MKAISKNITKETKDSLRKKVKLLKKKTMIHLKDSATAEDLKDIEKKGKTNPAPNSPST